MAWINGPETMDCGDGDGFSRTADMEFCALAHEHLPALLAELDRLERERDAALALEKTTTGVAHKNIGEVVASRDKLASDALAVLAERNSLRDRVEKLEGASRCALSWILEMRGDDGGLRAVVEPLGEALLAARPR